MSVVDAIDASIESEGTTENPNPSKHAFLGERSMEREEDERRATTPQKAREPQRTLEHGPPLRCRAGLVLWGRGYLWFFLFWFGAQFQAICIAVCVVCLSVREGGEWASGDRKKERRGGQGTKTKGGASGPFYPPFPLPLSPLGFLLAPARSVLSVHPYIQIALYFVLRSKGAPSRPGCERLSQIAPSSDAPPLHLSPPCFGSTCKKKSKSLYEKSHCRPVVSITTHSPRRPPLLLLLAACSRHRCVSKDIHKTHAASPQQQHHQQEQREGGVGKKRSRAGRARALTASRRKKRSPGRSSRVGGRGEGGGRSVMGVVCGVDRDGGAVGGSVSFVGRDAHKTQREKEKKGCTH